VGLDGSGRDGLPPRWPGRISTLARSEANAGASGRPADGPDGEHSGEPEPRKVTPVTRAAATNRRDASADRLDGADREPPERAPPPAFGRTRSSDRASPGNTGGEQGEQPQGREWMKHSAGFGEEQTARVVGNGEGGPKRGWKPATRRGGNAAPGSGFPGLGAPERRRTPWEEVRDEGMAFGPEPTCGRTSGRGPRGRTQGQERYPGWPGNWAIGCQPEDARVQPAREKGAGGAGKPNERLRQAVRR
jgi:hypothetical protein